MCPDLYLENKKVQSPSPGKSEYLVLERYIKEGCIDSFSRLSLNFRY